MGENSSNTSAARSSRGSGAEGNTDTGTHSRYTQGCVVAHTYCAHTYAQHEHIGAHAHIHMHTAHAHTHTHIGVHTKRVNKA